MDDSEEVLDQARHEPNVRIPSKRPKGKKDRAGRQNKKFTFKSDRGQMATTEWEEVEEGERRLSRVKWLLTRQDLQKAK